jgi:hypothetical protein
MNGLVFIRTLQIAIHHVFSRQGKIFLCFSRILMKKCTILLRGRVAERERERREQIKTKAGLLGAQIITTEE